MRALKVLVVDDNQAVLDVTKMRLEREGHHVDVTTAVLGLAIRVGDLRPDVVLLDVDLPATRGDQLAHNLKKLRGSRDFVVVFHSAEDEALLMDLVGQTGAAGYICKGLGMTQFLARFHMVVDRHVAKPSHPSGPPASSSESGRASIAPGSSRPSPHPSPHPPPAADGARPSDSARPSAPASNRPSAPASNRPSAPASNRPASSNRPTPRPPSTADTARTPPRKGRLP